MSSVDLSAIEAALEPLKGGFEADGYALKVLPAQGDSITIAVEALEDACEECLVPENLFRRMIDSALAALPESPSYQVRYPATGD